MRRALLGRVGNRGFLAHVLTAKLRSEIASHCGRSSTHKRVSWCVICRIDDCHVGYNPSGERDGLTSPPPACLALRKYLYIILPLYSKKFDLFCQPFWLGWILFTVSGLEGPSLVGSDVWCGCQQAHTGRSPTCRRQSFPGLSMKGKNVQCLGSFRKCCLGCNILKRNNKNGVVALGTLVAVQSSSSCRIWLKGA
jgi:hypothetical protein